VNAKLERRRATDFPGHPPAPGVKRGGQRNADANEIVDGGGGELGAGNGRARPRTNAPAVAPGAFRIGISPYAPQIALRIAKQRDCRANRANTRCVVLSKCLIAGGDHLRLDCWRRGGLCVLDNCDQAQHNPGRGI